MSYRADLQSNNVDLQQILATVNALPDKVSGGENQLHALLDGSITDITSDVLKVLSYACRGATALVSVNLPKATVLGQYAFYGCTALRDVQVPVARNLGSYSWYNCTALESIVLPTAVGVPSYCFDGCTKLKTVDLGNAYSIDGSAFRRCTALKTLVLRREAAVVSLSSTAFSNANFQGDILVPRTLLDTYRSATNWSAFASEQFKALEDYTVDGTIWGDLDEAKIAA